MQSNFLVSTLHTLLVVMLISSYTDLSWNSRGAFIGKLVPLEDGVEKDAVWSPKGSLPFLYFLAVPLLPLNDIGSHTIRFGDACNPIEIASSQSTIELSAIVAAFVHFAYIKTMRTMLFTDLQGISFI